MSIRYAWSFRGEHGGSKTAPGYPFCSQPGEKWDGDVAYCSGCGWPYAIRCAVPGCTRMRGNRKGSPLSRGMTWLCTDHWKLPPQWMKAIYRRAEKREALAIAKHGADNPLSWPAGHARHRLYMRMVRAARERAWGIG